jgi:heme exporter protein D
MAAGGKNRRFLIWLAIGTALLALATAALLTFLLHQRQLIAQNRSLQTDSVTAFTFQAEREFMRYRQTLDAAVNSRRPPDSASESPARWRKKSPARQPGQQGRGAFGPWPFRLVPPTPAAWA